MFRFKTIDELMSEGYAVTPAGDLIHAHYATVTREMLIYGDNFSQEVLKIIAESDASRCVDCHVYHAIHITRDTPRACD